MKRFIRHMTLFMLPIMVIAIGLEIIGESIPNSYTYKRDYMAHHGSQIRTLILGSSYAYDGLNPSEMQDAFNLANSSQTIEDDFRLLARYIDSMDSLQTVIIGVGTGTWADVSEAQRRTYYTIYMDLYPRWPINRNSMEVFNLELLTKKIIKYALSRDVTRCDLLGQRIGHDSLAVAQGAEFWNKDIASLVANDRVDVAHSQKEIARNVWYMDSIASLCAAHDVRLVVVAMPTMEAYRQQLPKEQLALTDSLFVHLSGRAQCIDASAWEIPDEGWYNATHLTREASVGFTRLLMDSIW